MSVPCPEVLDLTFEGGAYRFSRNLGKSYHSALRKIPKERRFHLHRSGSRKMTKDKLCYILLLQWRICETCLSIAHRRKFIVLECTGVMISS
jgi:hypothetical protein